MPNIKFKPWIDPELQVFSSKKYYSFHIQIGHGNLFYLFDSLHSIVRIDEKFNFVIN